MNSGLRSHVTLPPHAYYDCPPQGRHAPVPPRPPPLPPQFEVQCLREVTDFIKTQGLEQEVCYAPFRDGAYYVYDTQVRAGRGEGGRSAVCLGASLCTSQVAPGTARVARSELLAGELTPTSMALRVPHYWRARVRRMLALAGRPHASGLSPPITHLL